MTDQPEHLVLVKEDHHTQHWAMGRPPHTALNHDHNPQPNRLMHSQQYQPPSKKETGPKPHTTQEVVVEVKLAVLSAIGKGGGMMGSMT